MFFCLAQVIIPMSPVQRLTSPTTGQNLCFPGIQTSQGERFGFQAANLWDAGAPAYVLLWTRFLLCLGSKFILLVPLDSDAEREDCDARKIQITPCGTGRYIPKMRQASGYVFDCFRSGAQVEDRMYLFMDTEGVGEAPHPCSQNCFSRTQF